MAHRYDEPQFDQKLGQFFQQAEEWLKRNFQGQHVTRIVPIAVIVVAVAWLATGVYVVDPGHVGVVRTFGKETQRTEPGLNYRYPYPFQKVDVVSVEQVRRIEVGVRAGQRISEESMMLTGDENIVEAQMVVQYRVADPSKYLFRLRDPEGTLRGATEVSLRSAVGSMTIDQVMIEERARVQEDTRAFVQKYMDDYQSGISISEVRLQAADPPDQVRDAFHDVVRAREDREKLINQARGYQADILPRARGEAQKILREAEGYQEERVLLARGEAARFLSVLAEYQNAREVTRGRLHLETVEKILPNIDKVIMGGDVTERMLPLLPITAVQPPAAAPPASAAAAIDSRTAAAPMLIRRSN
jgi:modulator of FtsH protease HflK